MSENKLDLTNEPNPPGPTRATPGTGRKFVGMQFECCSRYARVYVNREGTAYEGRCPRCAKPVTLRIGEGGTNARFFKIS